jgi:F-type H+-transporting ATPase subunit delta
MAAESTTIARPYAEAAFALAREQDALPAWSQMLRLCAEVVRDPRVARTLDNPRLSAPEKSTLLLGITGDRLNEDARSFVRVLVDADRIGLLPEVSTLFDALKDHTEGAAKADIETAFELSAEQLAELTAALERRFGKRIEASVRINPALIGGARVSVGDSVIDASVQAKLAAMAAELRA